MSQTLGLGSSSLVLILLWSIWLQKGVSYLFRYTSSTSGAFYLQTEPIFSPPTFKKPLQSSLPRRGAAQVQAADHTAPAADT